MADKASATQAAIVAVQKASELAGGYQAYHHETVPAGTVGLFSTILVPSENMRPWFGLSIDPISNDLVNTFKGPIYGLITRMNAHPTFEIGPDGWSLYAKTPLAAGSWYSLGVEVCAPGSAGSLAYRLTVTVK